MSGGAAKSAQSAKSLFRATKPKRAAGPEMFEDLPTQMADAPRDPLDFDPTPPDATEAVLALEAWFMAAHGDVVWENAVGAGHIAKVLIDHEFDVVGSDIVDRGWPGTMVRSFFDFANAPAPIIFTNPPYNQINARDGHGRWIWHAFELGIPYIALLLNADWANARINGHDRLFLERPPSIEYKCCWKIGFRGPQPPQRNSWFVWDVNRPALGPNRWVTERLFNDPPDPRQSTLFPAT